jgi:hypothetical protein
MLQGSSTGCWELWDGNVLTRTAERVVAGVSSRIPGCSYAYKFRPGTSFLRILADLG